jgi:tetratricopeptide (TPR) repeat protein
VTRQGIPILLAVVLHLFTPAIVRSQVDDRLEAAELAADAGDVERAREYLRSWLDSESAARLDADVGRALFLRARLAENVDSAEVDYLEAAVRGGESYAALARLRLAQLRLTSGRPAIAAADLELLRADFPGSPLVPESWLWSGFALEGLGDPAAACAAWTRAADGSPSDPVVSQARAGLSACAAGQTVEQGTVSYTVQLGAFGRREAAADTRTRAAATGVDVRVYDPDSSTPLYRVRVGHFTRKDDAARLAVRLRSDGFEAIVVSEDP